MPDPSFYVTGNVLVAEVLTEDLAEHGVRAAPGLISEEAYHRIGTKENDIRFIILDFRRVSYLGSTSSMSLFRLAKMGFRQNFKGIACNLHGQIPEQLRLTQADQVFLTADTLEKALLMAGVEVEAKPVAKTDEKININKSSEFGISNRLGKFFEDRPSGQGGPVPPLEEKIGELFAGMPEDPEQRLGALGGRIDAFREAATKQLQAALNAYLETQTPQTYGDKQAIAATVNAHLDRLGLAIGYQGQACNFAATMGGEHPRGRFLLVPKGSKKPLLARVNLTDFLPLELVDAQPRREGLREWGERVQASRLTGRGAAKED
jgi:anti-anti-sigma regulatory factor